MQGLFFPIPIDLAVHEVSVLEQMSPVLSQSGFNITQSGPKSFLIDAIPAFLKEDEAKDIVLNIVEDTISLDNDITESLEVKKKRRLAELVCRFVKSRKESILMTEAIKLVDELSKTSSPCFCPQGNKTIVLLSSKYVSSYFTGEKVRNNK
jgi:DNA mismatch repair protein MutL